MGGSADGECSYGARCEGRRCCPCAPAAKRPAVQPLTGFYVPIPPEFRTWGVIPALDFIDPLMRVLAANYYSALLSAAEIHGAAHQRPQAFQVAVDKRIKDRDLGRVCYRSKAADVPVVLKNSAAGVVRVS
ncbi:MAG: hypothetical protein HQ453_10430, partial [Actinobacteria bacterium]|nr:hypothetical protein [Actinomycetota bacterium]